MATSRARLMNAALPPSPPPSPPKVKQRRKKPDDPFYSIPLTQPIPRPPSPEDDAQEPVQSRVKTMLLTPILFISFLLSLFIINRSDRAARVSSHPQPHPRGFIAYLSPRAWLDPEPYQDPTSTAWDTASPSSRKPDAVVAQGNGNGRKRSWFVKKKHRAVARLQVGDAFELRGWVVIAMLVFGLMILAGAVWGLKRLIG
ncbi:uncharacterized protein BDZ99DRAFT_463042 [Mytilinidion resinicola]|uniref:Uncharacterized protein n=1 Tax=Mytilinidion resinicola TaxID=574789 RepID=A0A6A6YPF5_9PEZI|nr:uncharacterized protein BDZ99DRAFT_463042 [Mytilinidion resinicola]KAF2810463.1 hypothetical protein BDZ99DRAFT_463042 [Mytilinidion resinicola]